MPEQSLGDRIRELREKQGLTREQLNTRTKILVRYIEALEEGRWDLLPGQVYLKPFVKNIADVLNADHKELYALIEHTDLQEEPKIKEPAAKQFDYRWLVVIGLVIFVAVIILLIRPSGSSDKQTDELPTAVTIINHKPVLKEKRYTSDLDVLESTIDMSDYHTLELTAIDSVWLLLIAGDDTLYTGILLPGRKIKRNSIKPIKLTMGRKNCLDIVYDNLRIDREKRLKNLIHIDFSDFDLSLVESSGGPGEGQ